MKALTPKQQTFVGHYLAGASGAEAARRAGYSALCAGTRARDLLRQKAVKAAIEVGRKAIVEKYELTLETLVQQLREDREFAIKTENATAAVRASELLAKLGGLMVDRIDARHQLIGNVNVSINLG